MKRLIVLFAVCLLFVPCLGAVDILLSNENSLYFYGPGDSVDDEMDLFIAHEGVYIIDDKLSLYSDELFTGGYTFSNTLLEASFSATTEVSYMLDTFLARITLLPYFSYDTEPSSLYGETGIQLYLGYGDYSKSIFVRPEAVFYSRDDGLAFDGWASIGIPFTIGDWYVKPYAGFGARSVSESPTAFALYGLDFDFFIETDYLMEFRSINYVYYYKDVYTEGQGGLDFYWIISSEHSIILTVEYSYAVLPATNETDMYVNPGAGWDFTITPEWQLTAYAGANTGFGQSFLAERSYLKAKIGVTWLLSIMEEDE